MSFLPEDYQAPRTTNFYMKLVEGENRIRIMSRPIFGWLDWKDNRPIRFSMDKKPLRPIDAKKPIKHFWAFVVFNYQEEQIQIMEVTQATVRKSLEALCRDKDWGEPYGYDIKIMKTGEGVDTEYAVNPVPHKPIDPYLITCFNERRCNLNALYESLDPFSSEWDASRWTDLADVDTKPVVNAPTLPTSKKVIPFEKEEKITDEMVSKLTALLAELPEDFSTQLHDFMSKGGIEKYSDMNKATYDRIIKKGLLEKVKDGKNG